MIFSRLLSKLLSQPFDHEDPNLELIQAPEGERGYASRSSGAIRHVEASLHCLFNNEDLAFDGGLYYMQSIGQEIELSDCPATLGEHGEGTGDAGAVITPLCACEQSLYWAQQAGYACAEEELIYFYHPDYLGSVEFITDMRGEPYQFFLNTLWGENLENQFAKNYTAFSSRFRFNGKEWDEETGNFYYGARYYDPKVSVWLSVDRLASKYPGWSPYNFVMNNPINLIDPNGDSVNYAGWKERLHVAAMRLMSKEFRSEFNALKGRQDMMFTYQYDGEETAGKSTGGYIEHKGFNKHRTEELVIHYKKALKNDFGGLGRSKWHNLFEETFHSADYATGRGNLIVRPDPANQSMNVLGSPKGDRSSEARAWMFAAKNAPFVPHTVSITQARAGATLIYTDPLVRRMRSASQSKVESWLYGTYNVNYYNPANGYQGSKTHKGPYNK